jgi:predicted HD phosphohydrolase
MQVLHHAFRESHDTDLILAAALHDVGKTEGNHGHDEVGAEMMRPFVSAKTCWLIEQHMRIWCLLDGGMKRTMKVQDLVWHPWLPELVLLARWDRMGRNPRMRISYSADRIVDRLNRCAARHFGAPRIGRFGMKSAQG